MAGCWTLPFDCDDRTPTLLCDPCVSVCVCCRFAGPVRCPLASVQAPAGTAAAVGPLRPLGASSGCSSAGVSSSLPSCTSRLSAHPRVAPSRHVLCAAAGAAGSDASPDGGRDGSSSAAGEASSSSSGGEAPSGTAGAASASSGPWTAEDVERLMEDAEDGDESGVSAEWMAHFMDDPDLLYRSASRPARWWSTPFSGGQHHSADVAGGSGGGRSGCGRSGRGSWGGGGAASDSPVPGGACVRAPPGAWAAPTAACCCCLGVGATPSRSWYM